MGHGTTHARDVSGFKEAIFDVFMPHIAATSFEIRNGNQCLEIIRIRGTYDNK